MRGQVDCISEVPSNYESLQFNALSVSSLGGCKAGGMDNLDLGAWDLDLVPRRTAGPSLEIGKLYGRIDLEKQDESGLGQMCFFIWQKGSFCFLKYCRRSPREVSAEERIGKGWQGRACREGGPAWTGASLEQPPFPEQKCLWIADCCQPTDTCPGSGGGYTGSRGRTSAPRRWLSGGGGPLAPIILSHEKVGAESDMVQTSLQETI